MTRAARRVAWALVVAAAAGAGGACSQDLTAPGQCPDFCLGGQVTVVDTVLPDAVVQDSAFRGYVRPHEAGALLVASLPAVQSRAWFRMVGLPFSYAAGDTTRDSIVAVDSLKLTVFIGLRDTAARNLMVHLHRLPLEVDSTTTFDSLSAAFAGAPIRSINLDSLLAKPGGTDSTTGDRFGLDTSASHLDTLVIALDSADVPVVSTDSGRLALGIRIAADTLAYAALGARRTGLAPHLVWYLQVDSLAGDTIVPKAQPAVSERDGFVFDPPPPALDSTLTVGGVPSARSLLRFDLPRYLMDSTQILRATLVLTPAVAAQGVPADSFFVVARAVVTDLGAKSPISSSVRDSARVHIGSTAALRIEVAPFLRVWASDSTAPRAVMLTQRPEGATFAEIRFHGSGAGAFRPTLEITYSPRFPFGAP